MPSTAQFLLESLLQKDKLVYDDSFYVILYGVLVHCNNNLTWQFVVSEIKPSKCCQLPNFSWNIPYKNNKISILWRVVQWDYCMGFWYNVVQILPDRELPSRFRYVSSVRAPISVGIFPTKIMRLAWGPFIGIFQLKLLTFKKLQKWKMGPVIQHMRRKIDKNHFDNIAQ